jgi:selenide,water dikinase
MPPHRVLLIGGGHSHALVLAGLAARPDPQLRLTVMSPSPTSVYSGMVPGVIAGQYQLRQAEIDVAGLARRAGAAWVEAAARRIDADSRSVEVDEEVRLPYDLLSIDIGTAPARVPLADDAVPVVPMRPIAPAIAQLERALVAPPPPQGWRIAVVGAGAAGCEVACALAKRLRHEPHAHVAICDEAARPLATHGARARRLIARTFAAYGIEFIGRAAVERVTCAGLRLGSGQELAADLIFWAAGSSAPALFAASQLPTDAAGFLLVDTALRCSSRPEVFASGDCATLLDHPRLPKAGVYAVRQAPVLAHNLRASARGEPLRRYRPQHVALALLNTGDGRAILSYGPFAWQSRWAWRLKDRIDRRFIARFAP